MSKKQRAVVPTHVDQWESTAIQKVVALVNAVIQAKLVKMAKAVNDVRHIQERTHVVNVQQQSKANNKVQNVNLANLVKPVQLEAVKIHIVLNEMARILVIQEIHVIRVHVIRMIIIVMKILTTVVRALTTVR
ncbi:hypothetical protein HMPREF0870_01546 [Veillonella atypica KON]|uniref:Uncharacterized protein n=1 Tax=Veillonella atypica KON TaxID=1128111 RepID=A0ABN0IJ00_9FIRM|nr:hypothetical protein HMPREF0870_01546 [Veillonella atypica KON]